MNRIARVALVCGAIVASSCSSAQDVAPTTTGPLPTTAAPSTTTSAPATNTAEPETLRSGVLAAGIYMVTPFASPDGWGVCMEPPQAGCSESIADDSISFTFTVPDGWSGAPLKSIWLTAGANSAPEGAGMIFNRGGGLYSDPCDAIVPPDIPVGPTVDDFANALADHPLLEVTTPIDVSLGGYSGRYVDLQVPSDITGCTEHYWAWEPGLYAQGPSQRWHLWILDVDGVRVVVESMDYPGTSAEDRTELQAIVDSVQIQP